MRRLARDEAEALAELRASFCRMPDEDLLREHKLLAEDIRRSAGRDPYMQAQLRLLLEEMGRRHLEAA